MKGDMFTDHALRIEKFMRLAGQDCPVKPTLPSVLIRKHRARLILEECLETLNGLGFKVSGPDSEWVTVDDLVEVDSGNLLEIVDGCADLSVVTIGTLIACGVQDYEVLEEVDKNNLAKFGPGGYKNEVGKWIKPPGHPRPDLESILKTQVG